MQAIRDMANNAMGGGPSGPAGPQGGVPNQGAPAGQHNNNSNSDQQSTQPQQQQQQQQQSQNTNGANQDGHKLSDRPIIPDERFARNQPKREEPKQPEPEPTLASKYGIVLPGVPLEGTNTYTGVQSAEDLSSNLPVIVSNDTTVAHTGIGRAMHGAGNNFGFTGAADQAHNAAYGGSGSANSPEVMAKKAAEVTSALGVTEHIAGI